MATEIGGTPIVFGHPCQPNALPLDHPKARYGGFTTETKVLSKGHVQRPGCLPLPCDIKLERDQPVKLRDGATIYVDIYRPVTDGPEMLSPAILAWSPYGKSPGGGNQVLDDFPFRMGVPLRSLSEYQAWEGPDPGYWVQHGYAIVNADARGAGKSDGNIYVMGSQEGQDGADVIDWIGSQHWCNGKVGLSGNSWLAAVQWHIAAHKPKHLAAIAPWEGFSDIYREGVMLGGVASKPMLNFILQILQITAGTHSWENVVEMGIKHNNHGAYHMDKAAVIEDIDVPAYVVASWTNVIHVYGTFRAYCRLRGSKWLRVHDTIEWPDYYDSLHQTDLHRFFDRYLKGVDNGWESTPGLRAKILDTNNPLPRTGTTITAPSFPPRNTPLTLFFDGDKHNLSATYPQQSKTSYEASQGELQFEHTFTEDTTCCGTIQLQLAVSLSSAKDSDLFIYFEKLSTTRKVCEQLTIPFRTGTQTSILRTAHWLSLSPLTKVAHYKGPKGQLRLSRREGDTTVQVDGLPISRMDVSTPVREDEVMVVRPPVLPIGMFFGKGEAVRVRVSGRDEAVLPPVDGATLALDDFEQGNKMGMVSFHCGLPDPAQGSWIKFPLLEPKLFCR